MNILMLVSALDCGGVETHIVSLAKEMRDRGHGVAVASSGGRLAAELEGAGISHIRLPLASHDPIKLALAVRKLIKLVRTHGFDIIHAHSRIAALVGWAVSKRCGVSMTVTAHAKFRSGYLLRRLSRWGTLSVTVSQDLKQYLCEEYGVLSDNVFVIPNGIDAGRFRKREIKNKVSDGFNVAFVSRMDKDCALGAKLLCEAAPRLAESIKGLEIYLCGGGNAYKKIKRAARRANKKIGYGCVQVLGHCDDVTKILKNADVFVGVSRAALEAMAMGVPTVLCGNEGFLGAVNPGNFTEAGESNFCCRGMKKPEVKAIIGEIIRLYRMDRDSRELLGTEISALVEELNSGARSAELTEGVYRKAMERAPDTRGGIVLCGFYGFGNTGDDSLLIESIKRCGREYGNARVSALTHNGKHDTERFGIRCVPRGSAFAVASEIRHAELLVFGGGTLLQERTSRRSLLYYIGILRYAQRMGVRCELWGNGLGIPRGKRSGRLLAKTLGMCAYVGLRDVSSVELAYRLCREFSVKAPPIYYEKDLALSSASSNLPRLNFLMRRYGMESNKGGFAVIAVSGRAKRYSVRLLSDRLLRLRKEGKGLLFIPMFPKEDIKLTRCLAKKYGGEVAEALSGRDMVGIMSKSSEVIGMRLHSLVFAFCAGVQFYGLGEDEKIESFCRENGGIYLSD